MGNKKGDPEEREKERISKHECENKSRSPCHKKDPYYSSIQRRFKIH